MSHETAIVLPSSSPLWKTVEPCDRQRASRLASRSARPASVICAVGLRPGGVPTSAELSAGGDDRVLARARRRSQSALGFLRCHCAISACGDLLAVLARLRRVGGDGGLGLVVAELDLDWPAPSAGGAARGGAADAPRRRRRRRGRRSDGDAIVERASWRLLLRSSPGCGAGGRVLLAARRQVALRDRRSDCGSTGCRPCRPGRPACTCTSPSPQPSLGSNGSGRFICTVSVGRPCGRVRPRPRRRQHAVEVDVADAVGEQLVRVAVDDGDVVERLQDRLHLVGVVGPEVPVPVVACRAASARRRSAASSSATFARSCFSQARCSSPTSKRLWMPLSRPATVCMRCIGRHAARGPEVLLDDAVEHDEVHALVVERVGRLRRTARATSRPCRGTSRARRPSCAPAP